MNQIRCAAVAGSFYPGEPQALHTALAGHLARAATATAAATQANAAVAEPSTGAASGAGASRMVNVAPGLPKLLLVQPAGYIYSGVVAATAYGLLAPLAAVIRRVVLLCHRVSLRGLALPRVQAFETPLGRVAIDGEAAAAIAALPQVLLDDRPHALEHSLEEQLPFLHTVLGNGFKLIPLAVGAATPQQVDEVIERLWGGDESLFVISSDLSHFLGHGKARVRDRATVQRILGLASDLHGDESCGAIPLNGVLLAARRHGLRPRLLSLCNSGDTAGDRQCVVGFGAIAFEATPPAADAHSDASPTTQDTAALGMALLATARAEIAGAMGQPAPGLPAHQRLQAPGASFVTLHDARGVLCACIGQLDTHRSLGEDLRHNARATAFGDSHFSPLTAAEWPGLQIEVRCPARCGRCPPWPRCTPQSPVCSRALTAWCWPGRASAAPSCRRFGPSCHSRAVSCKRCCEKPAYLKSSELRHPVVALPGQRLRRAASCRRPLTHAQLSQPASRHRHRHRRPALPAGGAILTTAASSAIYARVTAGCRLHEGQRGLCFERSRGSGAQADAMWLDTCGRS